MFSHHVLKPRTNTSGARLVSRECSTLGSQDEVRQRSRCCGRDGVVLPEMDRCRGGAAWGFAGSDTKHLSRIDFEPPADLPEGVQVRKVAALDAGEGRSADAELGSDESDASAAPSLPELAAKGLECRRCHRVGAGDGGSAEEGVSYE